MQYPSSRIIPLKKGISSDLDPRVEPEDDAFGGLGIMPKDDAVW